MPGPLSEFDARSEKFFAPRPRTTPRSGRTLSLLVVRGLECSLIARNPKPSTPCEVQFCVFFCFFFFFFLGGGGGGGVLMLEVTKPKLVSTWISCRDMAPILLTSKGFGLRV